MMCLSIFLNCSQHLQTGFLSFCQPAHVGDVHALIWPCNTLKQWPVLVSHSRMVRSLLPLASTVPLRLKAIDNTLPVCPCKVLRQRPVLISHKRIAQSSLPLASVLPSGPKATD